MLWKAVSAVAGRAPSCRLVPLYVERHELANPKVGAPSKLGERRTLILPSPDRIQNKTRGFWCDVDRFFLSIAALREFDRDLPILVIIDLSEVTSSSHESSHGRAPPLLEVGEPRDGEGRRQLISDVPCREEEFTREAVSLVFMRILG